MSASVKESNPRDNRLLNALLDEGYQRILPDLEYVPLALGDIVYDAGEQLKYIYFPTTSIISLVYTMLDGATAEMGLVGNEGVVGIALFMGGTTTPSRAIVQGAGAAFRMKAKIMQEEFKRGGEFQVLLLRYTQALITQISQTAVCNRLHSTEQRLCRWLLLMQDRSSSKELKMTHEFISIMLGIRREGVTLTAGHLQEKGFIHYSRGHITILNRQGLEDCSCECYKVVKDEFDRLLG